MTDGALYTAPDRNGTNDMRGIPRVVWAWVAVVVLLVVLLVNVLSLRHQLGQVRDSVYSLSSDVQSSMAQLNTVQPAIDSGDVDTQCRLLGALAKAQHIDVATLLADASGPCSDTLLGR